MREIVHIQAGQCGNQIGAKFWEVRLIGNAASAIRRIFEASTFSTDEVECDKTTDLYQGLLQAAKLNDV